MASKQTNAGAEPAPEALHLPPGKILQQLAGTVSYDAKGKALGVVGRDVPAQLLVQLNDGTIRPLKPAEARAYKRWLA
ncbi:MAG: hypothetical protein H7173_01765 [Rhodoferax sp.]|nr:hypothetical protein [Pseudorhodobacter sp.]